jgi:hypothetical protein
MRVDQVRPCAIDHVGDGMVKRIAAVALAAVVLAGTPAIAADFEMAEETVVVTEAVPPGGWNFRVTPYGWFTGVNGTITAAGRSVSTAASFPDLVQNSDQLIPFMGYAQAKKGRFTIFGDFFYSKIGFSKEDTKQTNPIAGLEITTNRKAHLDTTLTVATAAVAYDAIQQGGTNLGFFAGARYWYTAAEFDLKITKDVNLSNLGLKKRGKFAVARNSGTDWVDPIIGMRVTQEITPRDEITLMADIGGFGVGSQFSWEVFGGYSHSWALGRTCELALALGYRILSADYQQGSGTSQRGLDLTLHGPLAGLSLRF